MGGNTFEPYDFVLNEIERKPEDAELKSDSTDGHDRRQWYRYAFLFASVSEIHFMYFFHFL